MTVFEALTLMIAFSGLSLRVLTQKNNHEISRWIVNFAIENGIGLIRMEQLANIRKTAITSLGTSPT